MAARRVEIDGEMVRFDHGAQYFTARDAGFREAVASWEARHVVERWDGVAKGADDPAFVGSPGMNGPIKAMSDDLDEVLWSVRIEGLTRENARWRLTTTDGGEYTANTVLVAIPAEQASDLLQSAAPRFADIAASVTSEPCWAVMAAFEEKLAIAMDSLRDAGARISWAARNSSKPRRNPTESWVLHASPARRRQIIARPKEEAAQILLADFFSQARIEAVEPIHLVAHRWLYAQPASLKGDPARFDAEARIGLAGDYLHSPRVEGAWLSGTALAERVLGV